MSIDFRSIRTINFIFKVAAIAFAAIISYGFTVYAGTAASKTYDARSMQKDVKENDGEYSEVKIIAAGDNLIHAPIYNYALKNNGSFDFLYNDIADTVKEADFAVINQETPLVSDPAMYSDYPRFGTPASLAGAIKAAGFDAVTLSTNHMFDKGGKGIKTTLDAFRDNNIMCIGGISEKPYRTVLINGIKVAFLNYTYSTNGIPMPKGYKCDCYLLDDENKIKSDIELAKGVSDAVIVFLHWGREYSKEPDAVQLKWTEIMYSCGVTAVIGTHPHVLQRYEMYSDASSEHEMLVYYSLGNFISANRVRGHNSGGIASFTLRKSDKSVKIIDYDLTEINTDAISVIRKDRLKKPANEI